jgi:hypothetical protein
MTEGTTDLAKLIEHHARIIRMLIVVGTCAIVAVQFYCVTEIFTALPDTIVLNYMGQIDKIVPFWNAAQANQTRKINAEAAKTETAPAK